MHAALSDVQYFLAAVLHNLDAHEERDKAATRQLLSEELAKANETVVVEEEVMQVWRLVTNIGACVSAQY